MKFTKLLPRYVGNFDIRYLIPGLYGQTLDMSGLTTLVLPTSQALTTPTLTNPAITGTITGTSTSSSALAIGANGATNPVLQIDASTASVATGVSVKGAAAAGGVALTATSSTTNENLTIDAKGSGTLTLNGTATGGITLGQNTTVTEAKNIVLGSTTGTKIGTATTQKLAFYNSTPVVQPSATGNVATTAAGGTTTVFVNTTFTGGTGSTAYTVADIIANLKALGILAA